MGFFYWLDHKAISCSEPEFFFEPYIGYVARNVQRRKCWVHLSRHKPNSVFLPPLIQINKALLRKKNLLSNRPNCFSKSKRSTQPNVLLISTTPTEVFFLSVSIIVSLVVFTLNELVVMLFFQHVLDVAVATVLSVSHGVFMFVHFVTKSRELKWQLWNTSVRVATNNRHCKTKEPLVLVGWWEPLPEAIAAGLRLSEHAHYPGAWWMCLPLTLFFVSRSLPWVLFPFIAHIIWLYTLALAPFFK